VKRLRAAGVGDHDVWFVEQLLLLAPPPPSRSVSTTGGGNTPSTPPPTADAVRPHLQKRFPTLRVTEKSRWIKGFAPAKSREVSHAKFRRGHFAFRETDRGPDQHRLKASLAARRARSAATQLAVKNHMKSPEIATRRYLIRA
jgi:hypothetical protein